MALFLDTVGPIVILATKPLLLVKNIMHIWCEKLLHCYSHLDGAAENFYCCPINYNLETCCLDFRSYISSCTNFDCIAEGEAG